MITEGIKSQIRKKLPGIIERSRMGDQNALAMLTGLHRQRNKNERTQFAYECALSLAKQYPEAGNGLAQIAGEGTYSIEFLCSKFSPLTVAIYLLPNRNVVDSDRLPREVAYYLESFRQLLNGDFSRFPQIQYELGV